MRLPYLAVAALAAIFASSDAVPSTAAEPDVSFVDRVTHDRVNEADAKRVLRTAGATNVLPSVPANMEEERAVVVPPKWAAQFVNKAKSLLNLNNLSAKVKKGSIDAWGRTARWKKKLLEDADAMGASLRQKVDERLKALAFLKWYNNIFESSKYAAANDVKAAPGAV
uniref:RxLR effector protein n=1 Tax=Peronospora matthiolae TaxID=2874970 RepID=A0AAV1TLZ6_9STRA